MMRVNLLRGLPPKEGVTPPPPPPEGAPLKRALSVLLVLLVASAVTLWLAKPEWIHLQRVSSLWESDKAAHADSLHHAQLVHHKASQLIEARQTEAIEWLSNLEALTADLHGAGAVTLTTATYTAAGEFVFEGFAPSAEALSALQEALVLIPGLDLRQSRATEIAARGSIGFNFHFAGRMLPENERIDTTASDTAIAIQDSVQTPVRNRVVPSGSLALHLDTLARAAEGLGIVLAAPLRGDTSRQGALTLNSWRLKGGLTSDSSTVSTTAQDSVLAPSSPFAEVRELLEQERFRGSPFAIQRITLSEKNGQWVVFLDILALSP
jgi:hypothetical protein